MLSKEVKNDRAKVLEISCHAQGSWWEILTTLCFGVWLMCALRAYINHPF